MRIATHEVGGGVSVREASVAERAEIEGAYPTVDDLRALNAALIEEGSVFRALALITFEEINRLRVNAGLSAYTIEQFKTALKNKMR